MVCSDDPDRSSQTDASGARLDQGTSKERKFSKREMRRVLIGLDRLICACWFLKTTRLKSLLGFRVGNDRVISWRPMQELEIITLGKGVYGRVTNLDFAAS